RTPRTMPMAAVSLRPSIRAAETTLVSAIIEPTERSMPRAMTTTAWATEANASGITEMARPWIPEAPNVSWIAFVIRRSTARIPRRLIVHPLRRRADTNDVDHPAEARAEVDTAALTRVPPLPRRSQGPAALLSSR